jgi:polyisoprenoid-binding protein YceI
LRPNDLFLSIATSVVLLAACAAPQPTATAVPPTPAPTKPAAAATTASTAAPTTAPATATTAPAAAPTGASTVAAKPTSAAPTTSAAPASAAQPAAAGARTFAIVPDQSEVELTVGEVFAEGNVQGDAVLTTKDIKGQIVVTREGKVVPDGSKFTVNLDSLKSDRGMRDNFIKRSTLQTAQFPNAEFQPTELRLNGAVPANAGEVKGQLVGNMTIHGVAKPVTFDLDSRLDGNTVKGEAKTNLKITDFGMQLPRVPVIASIEDLGRLQITFTANAAA